jgi:hypothetical protein
MLSEQSQVSRMSRIVGALSVLAALVLTANQTYAASDTDQYHVKGGSPDNGRCVQTDGTRFWADDTFNLKITVKNNGNGTYAVRTEYKGAHFVTRAGRSPNCVSSTPPGSGVVIGGIKGKMNAWVDETVISGTYDPNACGKPRDGICTTRGGFIDAVFGVTATENFLGYEFEFSSNDPRLTHNYWRESYNSPDYPNGHFGDIATG